MQEQAATLFREAAELQRSGRRADAIARFAAALALAPDAAERWYEFGYLLKSDARYDAALEAFGRALALGIARPEEVHLNRAVLYADNLRRDAEAESELAAALAIAPDYVPALLNLGNQHEQRGRREAALATYARLAEVAPPPGHPYHDLALEGVARSAVMQAPESLDDPRLGALEHAASSVQQDARVRANLLFALGRSYERLQAWDPAFDAFARANRALLRQAGRTYHRLRAEALTGALIAAFPTAAAPRAGRDENAATPLFICGMFRSGSTLIEQVLGAHAHVTAGGELDFLLRLAAERLAPFPASVAQLAPTRYVEFAREYRERVAALFPQALPGIYVTDKRPDNYQLIGLIKQLFPAARIIHTTRHPLDTGLSVFTQHLNPQVAGYACDLGDIGHHFGQYRRLMQHWKSLYAADIHDVHYDELVRDPESVLRRIFAFLQLDWDAGCLDFHARPSTVKTASYWQVRKPLYREASGRWRLYACHLAPLRDALLAAGIEPRELD
jgi:tetratricopeptide (TPR) repeat protein